MSNVGGNVLVWNIFQVLFLVVGDGGWDGIGLVERWLLELVLMSLHFFILHFKFHNIQLPDFFIVNFKMV